MKYIKLSTEEVITTLAPSVTILKKIIKDMTISAKAQRVILVRHRISGMETEFIDDT